MINKGVGLIIGIAAWNLVGCKSAPAASATDEAKMRSNFAKTGFNINDVPPEQRDRVRALMEQSKQPKGKP